MKWLKGRIDKLVRLAIIEYLEGFIELHQDRQYIIAVKDDEMAKDLAEVVEKHLDVSSGPRIAIITDRLVQVIEIRHYNG